MKRDFLLKDISDAIYRDEAFFTIQGNEFKLPKMSMVIRLGSKYQLSLACDGLAKMFLKKVEQQINIEYK